MLDKTKFKYCPRCSSMKLEQSTEKSMHCRNCNFQYFHNNCAAVAAIIMKNNKILLAKRGRDPKADMLDFPGGFVDYDESLEAALAREIKEELNLTVLSSSYFTSHSNTYFYKDVTYKVCDVFFHTELEDYTSMKAMDDIASVAWYKLRDLDPNLLAFGSGQNIIRKLKASN